MQICLVAALKAWRSVGYHKQLQSRCPGHTHQVPLLSTCKLQHANVLHVLYNVVPSYNASYSMPVSTLLLHNS